MPEYDSTIEYRDVPGYPYYKVGSDGSVWSCRAAGRWNHFCEWRQLKPAKDGGGYLFVHLHAPGQKKHWHIHRLVLAVFVGKCPEGMEACHEDGCRANNMIGNLRWDTRSNNHADKLKHGTSNRGEANNCAKLTAPDIIAIRKRREEGEELKHIACDFGITFQTVSDICRRKIWKHVA